MKKRSVSIHGHATSVALESEFWDELDRAAKTESLSMSGLIRQLDDKRLLEAPEQGLASYIRVWTLARVRSDQSR
ncbi:aryl-sulfate sulfotransferase [Algimonas arctica]|jgi:predicted DNA-binding ribbon-helix-helix protein|uniref:Aryl-sulfate sulfotransferase n=1 Tax=Algimonas arctica TaxID=1479486 RepID=A0A8J3CJ97_9PROT|nr:ribbon-helix-helix domain-containing protein [Algimonas arctica]GHA81399.1 aryl-sulfate sulfotransferase [Algimonas arctica]